jgi:hypothetical protein
MPRFHMPVDPGCPAVAAYRAMVSDDPMTEFIGAPVDEIMEGFERRHMAVCDRCRLYGAANIEIA